jgi:hypothetical protein
MKKMTPAATPDAYVEALDGWQRVLVRALRKMVLAASDLEETIRWGHVVYSENGPVLLIRAEEERVLFGFWRGQRLVQTEPRLKKGGKYEMATIEFRERSSITPALVRRLTKEAAVLNQTHGDPTRAPSAGWPEAGEKMQDTNRPPRSNRLRNGLINKWCRRFNNQTYC